MKNKYKSKNSIKESMVVTGIGLAAFYWICESFMYFFLEPEANLFQLILGPDLFQIWTRLLVLCIFAIFGSHVQYTYNKRRAAYAALRESEELSTRIIAAIPDPVVRMDINGEIQFVNDIALQVSGYERSEFIGKSMFSFIKFIQLFFQSVARYFQHFHSIQ